MRRSGVLYIDLDGNQPIWLAKVLLFTRQSLGSAEVNFLDRDRTGIAVVPDLHGRMRSRMRRAVWFPV